MKFSSLELNDAKIYNLLTRFSSESLLNKGENILKSCTAMNLYEKYWRPGGTF